MRNLLKPTVVMIALAGLSACVYQQAPAAPRSLTINAQQGQSQAQQNKDKGECTNTASATATSSESWSQVFAACMSGRGYGVQ